MTLTMRRAVPADARALAHILKMVWMECCGAAAPPDVARHYSCTVEQELRRPCVCEQRVFQRSLNPATRRLQ